MTQASRAVRRADDDAGDDDESTSEEEDDGFIPDKTEAQVTRQRGSAELGATCDSISLWQCNCLARMTVVLARRTEAWVTRHCT